MSAHAPAAPGEEEEVATATEKEQLQLAAVALPIPEVKVHSPALVPDGASCLTIPNTITNTHSHPPSSSTETSIDTRIPAGALVAAESGESCVTTPTLLHDSVQSHEPELVTPSTSIVPPTPSSQYFSPLSSPKDTTPPFSPPYSSTFNTDPHSSSQNHIGLNSPKLSVIRGAFESSEALGHNHNTTSADVTPDTMGLRSFIDGQRTLRIKRNMAKTNALTDYEAELKSGDSKKQKNAIRAHLLRHVKSDFTWPPPAHEKRRSSGLSLRNHGTLFVPGSSFWDPEGQDLPSSSKESVRDLIASASEDTGFQNERTAQGSSQPTQKENSENTVLVEWKERDDWDSELEAVLNRSDSGVLVEGAIEECQRDLAEWAKSVLVDFCTGVDKENVDQLLATISTKPEEEIAAHINSLSENLNGDHFAKVFIRRQHLADAGEVKYFRKRRRQNNLAEEMESNDGLRCYVERRDAWTGARTVHHGNFKRDDISDSIKKGGSGFGDSSDSSGNANAIEWDDTPLVPIAPSILPVDKCPMRANITPRAYDTIYDKVITQGLPPSCPINLQDMTSAIVQGWKRDGTWQDKPSSVRPGPLKKAPTFNVLFQSDSNHGEKDHGEKRPMSPTATYSAHESAANTARRNDQGRHSLTKGLFKGLRKVLPHHTESRTKG